MADVSCELKHVCLFKITLGGASNFISITSFNSSCILSHTAQRQKKNLEHSRQNSNRPIMLNGKNILLDHLYEIYQFDQTRNPVPRNRYLTDKHFKLTSYSKMRNHLADQVLDHEMLNRVRIHVSYVNFSNMNLTLCDSHKMKAHDLQLGVDAMR